MNPARPRSTARPAPGTHATPPGHAPVRSRERTIVAALLAAHLGLAAWGVARNSVTYDESFHVPAGVARVARGEAGISPMNPPLLKVVFGLAALASGARVPEDSILATRDQRVVAERFMRINADRFHRVYMGARVVSLLVSASLAVVVWWAARRRWGSVAGVASLVLFALSPEALAHAGVATMDSATALLWLSATIAADRFLERPGLRRWWMLALVVGAFAATRFTVVLVAPLLLSLAVARAVRGPSPPIRRWLAGAAALVPVVAIALALSYPANLPSRALQEVAWRSQTMQRAAERWPSWRPVVSEDLLRGLDTQMHDGEPGKLTTYFLGQRTQEAVPLYYPTALLLKWPLGLLGLLGLRIAWTLRSGLRRGEHLMWPVSIALYLVAVMLGGLDAGVRYVLPVLPLVCVWVGSLFADLTLPRLGRVIAHVALIGAALEGALAGPHWIAFFNRAVGGTARGQWLLNDSNVDWGQGLIALREEMARRGGRLLLTYHGTVDPAVYGVRYEPYVGGPLDPEASYVAISSYFLVGLPAQTLTRQGWSPYVLSLDAKPYWKLEPVATLGGSILLYRLRAR